MQDNQEKCKELAIRIYNLDEEVYKCVFILDMLVFFM